MRLKHLIELQRLISRFNDENVKYGTSYEISDVRQYAKGCYSLTLRFDELMYSPDVADLFRWCDTSNVSFSIHHYENCCCLFFQ